MKKLNFLNIALVLFTTLFLSCQDDNETCSDGVQNGTETGVDCGGDCVPCASTDYYFEISYGGNDYYYDIDLFQAGNTSYDEFGGIVPESNSLGDALWLVFDFPDTVKNVVPLLEGHRINFIGSDDTQPEVEITHALNDELMFSKNGLDSDNYYVDVSEVVYLRNEFGLFNFDIYSVKGTFVTKIENSTGGYSDASGSFFLQCSHSVFE